MHNKVAKNNRQKSSGSGMPQPLTNFHTFARIIKAINEYGKEQEQLISLIVIYWLKSVRIPSNILSDFTNLRRIRCDDNIEKNALRIVQNHGDSWAEFSHSFKIKHKPYLIWLPVPSVFNNLLLKILRIKNNGDFLFSQKHWQTAIKLLNKLPKRLTKLENIEYDNRANFFNYISQCTAADSVLSPLVKLCWFDEKVQKHNHIVYYIRHNTDEIRHDIFYAYQKYINRMLTGVSNENTFKNLFSLSFTHKKRSQIEDVSIPLYCKQSKGRIPELRRKTKSDDKSISQNYYKPPVNIGNSFGIKLSEVKETLDILYSKSKKTEKRTRNIKILSENFNHMTITLATECIIFLGCRPTHSIGPHIKFLDDSSFVISDKGTCRKVYLTQRLQRSILAYKIERQKLLTAYPSHQSAKESPLLLIFDSESKTTTPLTTALLKKSFKKMGIKLLPYQFRKFFAQLLVDLSCPSHIISTLMGHYRHGEQAGVIDVLELPKHMLLIWLEKIDNEIEALI